MKTSDEAWWTKARQARDQLVVDLLGHPAVSMIDIGLDPQGMSDTPVLRVHVRRGYPSFPNVPKEIEGFPVRVIESEYQLQSGV